MPPILGSDGRARLYAWAPGDNEEGGDNGLGRWRGRGAVSRRGTCGSPRRCHRSGSLPTSREPRHKPLSGSYLGRCRPMLKRGPHARFASKVSGEGSHACGAWHLRVDGTALPAQPMRYGGDEMPNEALEERERKIPPMAPLAASPPEPGRPAVDFPAVSCGGRRRRLWRQPAPARLDPHRGATAVPGLFPRCT